MNFLKTIPSLQESLICIKRKLKSPFPKQETYTLEFWLEKIDASVHKKRSRSFIEMKYFSCNKKPTALVFGGKNWRVCAHKKNVKDHSVNWKSFFRYKKPTALVFGGNNWRVRAKIARENTQWIILPCEYGHHVASKCLEVILKDQSHLFSTINVEKSYFDQQIKTICYSTVTSNM